MKSKKKKKMIQKNLFTKQKERLTDLEYYVILQKRLEHLWILVSAGSPRTNPPQIPRDNCNELCDPNIIPKVAKMGRTCLGN